MVKSYTCEKQPNFKSQLQVGMSILVTLDLGFTFEALIVFLSPQLDVPYTRQACLSGQFSAFLVPRHKLLWTMTFSLFGKATKAHLSEFYVCSMVCILI